MNLNFDFQFSASMNFVGFVWSHGKNITRPLAVISGQYTCSGDNGNKLHMNLRNNPDSTCT